MILSTIYRRLTDKDAKYTLLVALVASLFYGSVFGLYVGLILGLTVGLAFGLTLGFIAGLVFSFAFGLTGPTASLTAGLAGGLVFGLTAGLAVGLAFHLFPFSIPLLLVVFAAEEALFWLDREPRPVKRGRYSFTVQKKLEALLDVGLGLGAYSYVYAAATKTAQIGRFLGQAAPYVFYGTVAAGILLLIVVANSLKYREKPKTG